MDTNDRSTNSTTKSSSSNSINHTLDIIKAAFPYLDSQSQQSMELFIKTGELFETFQAFSQKDAVSTLSVRKESIDLESLLNGIRDVCNQQEKDFIDMILNFFRAKNLYSTYASLASTMASQTGDSDSASDLGSMFGMDGNPDMMEMLSSFLTPEQKSTFDNINMMFSVMQ
jgi:hypothetical protein